MNTSNNTNNITGYTELQQLLLDINAKFNNQSLQSINAQNPSINANLDLTQMNQLLIPYTNEQNQNSAVTLEYLQQHTSSNTKSLNQINSDNPLTNNLDFTQSQFKVKVSDPIFDQDVVNLKTLNNAAQTDKNKIVAIGDSTSQTQQNQLNQTTFIQGNVKQVINFDKTTSYQPIVLNQEYQITNPHQLITDTQLNNAIDEESKLRESEDYLLQNQINEIKGKPLNEWFTVMSNPLQNNHFNVNGNRIVALPAQIQNVTERSDASSIGYVNDAINTLGTATNGAIANLKTQQEAYTDLQVFNLQEDTQQKLDLKQNIVPLNEIPVPVSQLNMNAHRIENLAIPTGSVDPDLCALPLGYADTRYALKSQLNDYITTQDANDAFRSRLSTLSDIQQEEPANLNMNNYAINNIPDPVLDQQPVTLHYFNTHTGPSGSPDEIVNASGFSKVKVNTDESITITANTNEVINVQGSQIVISEPLFSISAAPGNVSNAILTKSQLDPYYMNANTKLNEIPYPEGNVSMNGYQLRDLPLPTELNMAANKQYVDSQITGSVSKIQNSDQSAIVNANTDASVSIKANNASQSLVVSSNSNNYRIANNNNIELQSNSIITLNASQYTQSTTPILSTSTAATTQYQVLNRNQNDARYYQNTTTLNDIVAPDANINMNGFQLDNVSDALGPLQVPNLAQTESLIANSGFKNKIQSQSGNASIICNQGSDTISIRANNDPVSIDVSSNQLGTYTIQTGGNLIFSAQEENFNNSLMRVVGSAGQGTVFLTGDLRSTAPDLNFGDQILTRDQNDALYLPINADISNLAAPTTSVSFGNQLLRNLQTPILDADASTKKFVTDSLIPYSTTSQISSTYLSKTDALSTYLTQSNAANTYKGINVIDTTIQSSDQLNKITCNQGLNGIDLFASNAGITNKICTISQPSSYPQSVQFVSPSRLFLTSGSGQFSVYSGTGQTSNAIYIGSSSDNTSQFCSDSVTLGNGSNRMGLVLSTGHDATNVPFSIICANTNSSANSLIHSPETSVTAVSGGNSLYQYANALSALYPIQNQFTKPCGLSYVQSTVQGNEFLTKTKADSLYSGSSSSQISSTGSSVVCSTNKVSIRANSTFTNPLDITKNNGYPGEVFQFDTTTAGSGILLNMPNVYFGSLTNVYSYGNVLLPATTTMQKGAFAPSSATEVLCQNSANFLYVPLNASISTLTVPTSNFDFNNKLITNLASGTIASGNTSSLTGGDVYSYISTLPSVITQQVYTVTINGSTTNGFDWGSLPNTAQTGIVQTQRVKGSGAQMITSSVVTAQSQTLNSSFASLQFTVSNASVRVTQAVPYTTTAFSTPGQQNIASLTFSQQAIDATHTCLQLYKPATNQGSAVFILYVYVDQF